MNGDEERIARFREGLSAQQVREGRAISRECGRLLEKEMKRLSKLRKAQRKERKRRAKCEGI